MLTRRTMTLALAGSALLPAAARAADDWRAKYKEIVFATVPSENASGVADRYAPFVDYLSRTLGVKVTLRIASDYAAAIEGQRAGNIQVVGYGPASYVRAYTVTHGGVEPFVTTINSDGSIGYYSVAYVRADDKATKLEDLKDPIARNANLPADAKATDIDRSAGKDKENWLVMIGVCTHLGCIPLGQQGDFGGWFCPCHGSQYDTAGRIRKGPAPENMAVPVFSFISDTKLRIG